jgi:hypothetical protein
VPAGGQAPCTRVTVLRSRRSSSSGIDLRRLGRAAGGRQPLALRLADLDRPRHRRARRCGRVSPRPDGGRQPRSAAAYSPSSPTSTARTTPETPTPPEAPPRTADEARRPPTHRARFGIDLLGRRPQPGVPNTCPMTRVPEPRCATSPTTGKERPLHLAGEATSGVARTGSADESVPRPVRDAQTLRHVICGEVVAGHRGRGRPREVVV